MTKAPSRLRKPERPRAIADCDLSPLFRKLVAPCYDHIKGQLAESLFKLLDRGWIRRLESGDYEVTPLGWTDLSALGIDLERLRRSKRKPVNVCVERYRGSVYPHTGSHLGALLTERMFELGWLKGKGTKDYELTESGINGLKLLGLKPDWFPVGNS